MNILRQVEHQQMMDLRGPVSFSLTGSLEHENE
jgi:hypothetical protein